MCAVVVVIAGIAMWGFWGFIADTGDTGAQVMEQFTPTVTALPGHGTPALP